MVDATEAGGFNGTIFAQTGCHQGRLESRVLAVAALVKSGGTGDGEGVVGHPRP